MLHKERKFKRTKEDFTCEKCGSFVKGNGYTNHCPQCLWSKHVDTNPGDRSASCKGMMRPVSVELRGGEYILHHTCVICKHNRTNKTSQQDDFEKLIALVNNSTS